MSSEASPEYFPFVSDIKLVKVSDWSSWSATIHGTLRGHHLLGHINGTTTPPILPSDADAATRQKNDVAKETWSKRDDRVAYIISSVDPYLRSHLYKFESVAATWKHLTENFVQANRAREYQLIVQAQSASQGKKSIHDFYSQMSEYWRELNEIKASSESTINISTSTKTEERRRLYQFLMALRSEFSTLAGQLIYRDLIPSLDSAILDLIYEIVTVDCIPRYGSY